MSSAGSNVLTMLLDDVFFDWLDGHARLPQPFDRALDLIRRAIELHRDEAHILRHAGAANAENQVELLYQLIQDRLLDEGPWITQIVALVDAIHFCNFS